MFFCLSVFRYVLKNRTKVLINKKFPFVLQRDVRSPVGPSGDTVSPAPAFALSARPPCAAAARSPPALHSRVAPVPAYVLTTSLSAQREREKHQVTDISIIQLQSLIQTKTSANVTNENESQYI